MRGEDCCGISRQPDTIHTGMNSGYQAIQLAYLWGATKIILLGYDMQKTGGKAHWHGDHPKGLGNCGNFSKWILAMNDLAKDLKVEGVEVVNCSRQTALKCFRRAELKDTL